MKTFCFGELLLFHVRLNISTSNGAVCTSLVRSYPGSHRSNTPSSDFYPPIDRSLFFNRFFMNRFSLGIFICPKRQHRTTCSSLQPSILLTRVGFHERQVAPPPFDSSSPLPYTTDAHQPMAGPSSAMAGDSHRDAYQLCGSRQDQAAVTPCPALVMLHKWNLPVKEMVQVRGGDEVAVLHEAVESEDASRCIHGRRELMLQAVKSEVVCCKTT
jgi:hypothetical protein